MTTKRSLLALVLLAPIGIGIALFAGVYVVRPRIILHEFDAFLRRHPVGSSIVELANDSFVDGASMTTLEPKTEAPSGSSAHRATIRAWAETHAAGSVDLMWTHTPPFGRVTATFGYEGGRIVAVSTHDLD